MIVLRELISYISSNEINCFKKIYIKILTDDDQVLLICKKICDEYYPTGKEDYFGEFEFCFENGNDYVDDMLESFTMQVYIHNNNVIKVSGYDI